MSADRLAMITARAKLKVRASRALTVVDYVQILPVPEAVSGYTDFEQDRYRRAEQVLWLTHTMVLEQRRSEIVIPDMLLGQIIWSGWESRNRLWRSTWVRSGLT